MGHRVFSTVVTATQTQPEHTQSHSTHTHAHRGTQAGRHGLM